MPAASRAYKEEMMMLRRTGLLSALLMVPVLLAACNGDTNPASPQSQNTSTSQPPGGGSSTSTSGTGTGTGTNTTTPPNTDASVPPALPCDAASDAGTACVAAHSVTRLLTKNYAGPLFQVQRASDKATQDIYPYVASTLPSCSAQPTSPAPTPSAATQPARSPTSTTRSIWSRR
jgi:hypothetical protein